MPLVFDVVEYSLWRFFLLLLFFLICTHICIWFFSFFLLCVCMHVYNYVQYIMCLHYQVQKSYIQYVQVVVMHTHRYMIACVNMPVYNVMWLFKMHGYVVYVYIHVYCSCRCATANLCICVCQCYLCDSTKCATCNIISYDISFYYHIFPCLLSFHIF